MFRQKCQLIFDGPLANKDEDYKVHTLLFWCDDKGLEIYNSARWAVATDALVLARVREKLEDYVTPRSNQIFARYQLRIHHAGAKTH